MDSVIRKNYCLFRDVPRSSNSVLSPPSLLFGNCFMMRPGSIRSISSDMDEDVASCQQVELITFCNALRSLKDTFISNKESSDGKVIEKLREVNYLLHQSLTRDQSLYAKDILEMAALVNSKIKVYYSTCDVEMKAKSFDMILCAIENLSVAFQKSMSDSPSVLLGRTESFENLSLVPCHSDGSGHMQSGASETGDEVDLVLLNVSSGIDKAIQHAMSWLDSAKFIVNYVEKRTALDADLAKHLVRLSSASLQTLRSERLMPLQSVYSAAFTQDVEIAEGIQRFSGQIQTEKFIQPLSARCVEHKKLCKDLRDTWNRETKHMREATENLRKSKAAYNARCRELMKTKEATQRVLTESNMLTDGGVSAVRVEKRRKMEEEAVAKAMTAQSVYEECIRHANETKTRMNATKKQILLDVRQLIEESDRVLKMVTVDYFTLMSCRMTAIPLQFQALAKSCDRYEPGSVYSQYAEHLSSSSSELPPQDSEQAFVFQPYSPCTEEKQDFRRLIGLSQESYELLPNELTQNQGRKSPLVEKSSAPENYAASRSLDSSPVTNRHRNRHRKLTNSSSFDALTDLDNNKDVKSDARELYDDAINVRGLVMSKVALMHKFKRLRTFARCRQCDSYIYFNGFECVLCGVSAHKVCLRNLRWECGHKKNRASFHGSYSSRPLTSIPKGLSDRVPYVVKKCIEQIDRTGLEVKGIFRVSAVKSRVEALCQKLSSEDEMVDVSDESPHTIASLLRQYLRQLDEPLIPFHFCQELVDHVKNFEKPENSELIERMKSTLSHLPGENFWTCSCLVHHLKRVAEFSETNLMSPSNLAVVFGPTLLRLSTEAVSINSLIDTQFQCRVVELLITNAQDIFGIDPIPRAGHSLDVSCKSSTSKEETPTESPDGHENLYSQRPTTVWFDKNPDGQPGQAECQAIADEKHFDDQSPKTDDGEDVCTESHSAAANSAPTSDDLSCHGDVSQDGDPNNLSVAGNFQRMRAYSPQLHRRINAVPPKRRETFNVRKPRGAEIAPKISRSVSDDEM